MGSGKSTVGRKLAKQLGLTFLDLDANIENVTGLSIPDIFSNVGEEGFRQIERHALDATASSRNTVIAVGGGALITRGSMHFAREHGTVVYLEASPEVLAERLGRDRNRPLVQKHASDLLAYVKDKLSERQPVYRQAHYTVDTSGKLPAQLSSEIAALVRVV